jgi:hypothetical protein
MGLYMPLAAQEKRIQAAHVSVCELLRNPREYHGRVVQVRAHVHPPIIDTPLSLGDPTCPTTILLDEKQARDHQNDHAFFLYLRELRPMEATLSGRFVMVLVPSEEPLLMLRLLRVDDVVPGPALFRFRLRRKPK